ncbi:MAG TPA: hypothetical protein VHO25_24045 [Polyangiaceae bacterium]|nr:hypothetical protein [Polyangiaceae bacterium]
MRWLSPFLARTNLLSAAAAALCFIVMDNSGAAACSNVELFFRFPPQTFTQAGHYRLEVVSGNRAPNLCEFSIGVTQGPELDRDMACQRPGIATRLNTRMNAVTLDGIVFRDHADELRLTMMGEDDRIIFQALASFPRPQPPSSGACGDLIYMIEPRVKFLIPKGGS